MFDMFMAAIAGITFVGLIAFLVWIKPGEDMKKPKKREAKARLEWYKQHRTITKYRK